MALKTRGKLIALAFATFGAAAALAFGTVAAADSGPDRPLLRVSSPQDQQSAGLQQAQETRQAPGTDARDCPFGHGSQSGSSSSSSSSGDL